MNKKEFLNQIKVNLKNFDESEINEILKYYDEIISYKMESGLTEEEAVESLGNVNNITNEIKVNLVMKRSDKKSPNSLKNFLIILGICSSPILLPLGIGFAALFFSLFVVMFSLVIALGASGISVLLAVFIESIRSISTSAGIAKILVQLGLGLFSSSFLLILTIELLKVTKSILNKVNRFFVKKVRNMFKKGDNING